MPKSGWRVEFSKSSLKSLDHFETIVSSRILRSLEVLGEQENPLQHKDVRPLEGKLKGYCRYRVGEYRIIFELDAPSGRIGVLAVLPRGKGYGR